MDDITGKYELQEELGRGSFGVVYKAWHESLHRTVAIKKLSEQFSKDTLLNKRFLLEARLAATLIHENLAIIHDFGEDEKGTPFIVMEFVDGVSLKEVTSSRIDYSLSEKMQFAVQICRGLQVVHEKQIVHRDIKPANIMLNKDGTIKIMDFGIAKVLSEELQQNITIGTSGALGTVSYMSPEQTLGAKLDHRSDIFSFGVLLYELASGWKPFNGNGIYTKFNSIQKDPPMEIIVEKIEPYPALWDIIRTCLQKKPEDRYQTMNEVRQDLEKCLENPVSGESSGIPAYHFLNKADKTISRSEASSEQTVLVDTSGSASTKVDKPPFVNPMVLIISAVVLVGISLFAYFMTSQPESIKNNAAVEETLKAEPEELEVKTPPLEWKKNTPSTASNKPADQPSQPAKTVKKRSQKTNTLSNRDINKAVAPAKKTVRPSPDIRNKALADSLQAALALFKSKNLPFSNSMAISTEIEALDSRETKATEELNNRKFSEAAAVFAETLTGYRNAVKLHNALLAARKSYNSGLYEIGLAELEQVSGLTASNDYAKELQNQLSEAQMKQQIVLQTAASLSQSGKLKDAMQLLDGLPEQERSAKIVQENRSSIVAMDRSRPVVEHKSSKNYNHTKPLRLQASIQENLKLDYVKLFYRQQGEVDFLQKTVNPSGNGEVSVDIPVEFHQGKEIEYYWVACDVAGNETLAKSEKGKPFRIKRKQKHYIPRAP
ncbi:MAG: serine/threonine protein kinase [Calditrichia bacterium]